jgi:hypothetical protein
LLPLKRAVEAFSQTGDNPGGAGINSSWTTFKTNKVKVPGFGSILHQDFAICAFAPLDHAG